MAIHVVQIKLVTEDYKKLKKAFVQSNYVTMPRFIMSLTKGISVKRRGNRT